MDTFEPYCVAGVSDRSTFTKEVFRRFDSFVDQVLPGSDAEIVLEKPKQVVFGGATDPGQAVEINSFLKMSIEVLLSGYHRLDLSLV